MPIGSCASPSFPEDRLPRPARRIRAAAVASCRFAAVPALGVGLLMAPPEAWALAVGTVTFVAVDAALEGLVEGVARRWTAVGASAEFGAGDGEGAGGVAGG